MKVNNLFKIVEILKEEEPEIMNEVQLVSYNPLII